MKKPPRHWLMKTEPSVYSIDDLARDGRTAWEGVRNYQARNFMRDRMRPDDRVLIYHSNAAPPGVVGLARVCSAAYPDPTALDPASHYYDSRSRIDHPIWFLVDVCFEEKFSRLISLAEMRADSALTGMALLKKGQRLSVMPVAPAHFARIIELQS
ncbi:MAG: EVE domain-containing protein [Desulfobacterales bacterium]|jgi:predicted RNA-binding protein with PUA-like domain|nr:EVE domain-containing protein [Desulfobacterales bacterium]